MSQWLISKYLNLNLSYIDVELNNSYIFKLVVYILKKVIA